MKLKQISETLCLEKNITISTVESCTGGGIANLLTNVAGSSKYFLGSIVAYSNDVKINELNIDRKVLNLFGPCSEIIAREMALAGIKKFHSTYSIATTGLLGPSGDGWTNDIGLVYLAIFNQYFHSKIYKLHFKGDRKDIKKRVINFAIFAFFRILKNNNLDEKVGF